MLKAKNKGNQELFMKPTIFENSYDSMKPTIFENSYDRCYTKENSSKDHTVNKLQEIVISSA